MRANLVIEKNQREIEEIKIHNRELERQLIGVPDPKKIKAIKEKIKEVPKPEISTTPILFDVYQVDWAFINEKGNIFIKTKGETFVLEYDEALWNKIENAFLN